MFKTSDGPLTSAPNDSMRKEATEVKQVQAPAQRKWLIGCDLAVLLVLGLLLFWGASPQILRPGDDLSRYHCYAIAFWQGQAGLQAHGLMTNAQSPCTFLTESATSNLFANVQHFPTFLQNIIHAQPTTQPLRILPLEYPFLTLIPFSIPLFASFDSYQIVFSLMMTLIAFISYGLLAKYQSRGAALAFACYLVLGNWGTAINRFDLLPAVLTLSAVLLAGKARWKWAFALLALATLSKFYPVILAIPFLIGQQAQYKGEKWLAWKRWPALGIFMGLCLLVTLLSFCFNVYGTTIPIQYFLNRPLQLESLPGSVIWISGRLGHPTYYNFLYQSLNIGSSLTRFVSPLDLLLEIVALVVISRLQLQGKLHIYEASLLTVLIILCTGKSFSPQYLIWVTPLIALVGKANWKWLLTWCLASALTTYMYPFHYQNVHIIDHFYPAIIVRNCLILMMTCTLFYWYNKRQPEAVAHVAPSELG